MTIQQMLMAEYGVAAVGDTGPLAAWQTNLWSAVSIDRLLSLYAGAFIALRDSTAGTTTTIGDNGSGGLDTGAISTFLGSHNGTSPGIGSQKNGTLRDFGPSTTAKQPAVATAGTFLGSLQFDAVTDCMLPGQTSGTAGAYTIYLRGKVRTTATQVILELGTNYSSGNAITVYYDSGALSVGMHLGSSYARSDYSGLLPNNNVFAFRFDPGAGSVATMAACFVNGTKQTRTGNGDSGTPSGSFGDLVFYLGGRANASLFSALNLHTMLIYQLAHSDADVASVSSIVAALA